jgi:phytoene desaturase
MKKQCEDMERGSWNKYLEYLSHAKVLHTIAMKRMVDKPLTHAWDYVNLTNIYEFLRYGAAIPHMKFVSRFFRQENLRILATFQDAYLSLNPFSAPTICSMFPYEEYEHGSFLIKGGMYAIVEALVQITKKYNIRIVTDQAVRQLIVEGEHVNGVLLQNGKIKNADIVVVNAPLPYAYTSLLPPNKMNTRLKRKKYSCSAIIFHWAVDRVYPQLKTHNLFFAKSYRDGFTHILDRAKPPSDVHFYIQAPTRTDKSRAPNGCDTMSVMIPINHVYPDHPVDWEKHVLNIRNHIISRLHKIGIHDIGKHIVHEKIFTPVDWERQYNLPFGSIYGLHHNITQLGYLRPSRKHSHYKNLFFVGADTHPGSSFPTVLQSSRFTCDAVLASINS